MSDSATDPYTKIPNALLELLPLLPDAECRIMLVIIRKTAGWQKACDVISLSQFEAATGMSHQGVINGVEAAMKRGILTREPSGKNNGFCYQIATDQVVNEVDHLKQSTKLSSQRSRPQVVNEVDHQVVNEVDTQKKSIKEKKERDVAPRKAREKRPPKNETETTPIVIRQTLADVCGLDLDICSKDQKLQVNTIAKRLYLAGQAKGKTPEETADTIRYVARYFERTDWRGKKGERPTPVLIINTWGAAIEARQPAANGRAPVSTYQRPTDTLPPDEIARRLLKAKEQ